MKALIDYFHEDGRWKAFLAIVYVFICLFDFVIVPTWLGTVRLDLYSTLDINHYKDFDPIVQVEMIKALTFQHDPFTLKGGGLFHLAFGALLTGSAISKLNSKPISNN